MMKPDDLGPVPDDPGRSPDVRTAFSTTDFRTTRNTINMASDRKVFNMKVVRLVEVVDFDIKTILLRVRMQKLQPD